MITALVSSTAQPAWAAANERWRHPALGRPTPTLSELRARTDPDARALWDGAVALAGWRAREHARLRAAWEALHDAPSEDAPAPVRLEPGVCAIDLARAFAALRPTCLKGLAVEAFGPRWRARIERADVEPSVGDALA